MQSALHGRCWPFRGGGEGSVSLVLGFWFWATTKSTPRIQKCPRHFAVSFILVSKSIVSLVSLLAPIREAFGSGLCSPTLGPVFPNDVGTFYSCTFAAPREWSQVDFDPSLVYLHLVICSGGVRVGVESRHERWSWFTNTTFTFG